MRDKVARWWLSFNGKSQIDELSSFKWKQRCRQNHPHQTFKSALAPGLSYESVPLSLSLERAGAIPKAGRRRC